MRYNDPTGHYSTDAIYALLDIAWSWALGYQYDRPYSKIWDYELAGVCQPDRPTPPQLPITPPQSDIPTVTGTAEPEWKWDDARAAAAFALATVLFADDATGVGVIDDPLAILAGLAGLGISVWANQEYIIDKVGDALDVFISWGKQDHRLTDGEVEKLKRGGVDVEGLKGKGRVGNKDLFKDKQGNVIVKPKDGSGEGEPTGININDPKTWR